MTPWLRLDPRMLLVHPVKEVMKFLPILIGLLVAGGTTGTGRWALLGVAAPVGLGVVRYLTTTWRIEGGRVELRRGVLHRHTLSTPVERVRTVDLTASPVHRVLGLATVVIGTGSVATDADERLELDALPREQAGALRAELLQAGQGAASMAPETGHDAGAAEDVVARFSPGWLWYAPFSSAGLVAAGAAIGGAAQLTDLLEIRLTEDDFAAVDGALVAALLVGALLVALVLTVGGYALTNGGFVLARHGAAWHVRRGLLTRRETSIDVARLAGVELGEGAALRLVRGRRLAAIVTGLPGSGERRTLLVPPAPEATVVPAAAAVLGDGGPLAAPLHPHGPRARSRRFVRALLGSLPVLAVPVVAVAVGASYWLLLVVPVVLVVAAALARDRARSLGHAHLDGHVVMRSGSLTRTRAVLQAPHVIGWNLRDTWFQRRSGLVTVAATTAGARGRIEVYDATTPAAVALALRATPGLLDEFLTDPR